MRIVKFGSYSGSSYPNLRFHPSLPDRILEGAVSLLLLAVLGTTFYFHFKIHWVGVEPSFGWMMAGASFFTTLLLGVSAYLPMRCYSFPFRLTDRNAGVQCMLAVRTVRVMNILLNGVLLSCLLSVADVGFSKLPVSVCGVLLALTFIVYYVLAYKYR